MGHGPIELETRVARCERALFGDDDSSDGLSARMHLIEVTTANIDATLKKLNWLIIAGVILGLLNLVLNKSGGGGGSAQSTVITGEAQGLSSSGSQREYLTTSDVAAKEGVSVREVTDMIANGEIEPPPVKDGREWRIAAKYRILPHAADQCGSTGGDALP